MNQALQDVIEHRRTTNVFEPNHTISDEQIEHLVHLATRAPTSFNLQNWRFLAVRTPERKAKLRKLAYDQAKVSEAGEGCRMQWLKENCGLCVIQRTPTHENP
jgi:nitroreductase